MFAEDPKIQGRVALVPQSPFIFNATVKENILFGRDFYPTRYAQAIHAACLNTDLVALPGGDLTELGKRCLQSDVLKVIKQYRELQGDIGVHVWKYSL